MPASRALDLNVQAPDLRALYLQLKSMEGNMQVELRRGVVAAAQPMVEQVKANASWSSRIPGAVKAKASFSAKQAGVTVSVNASKAPEARPLENGGSTGTFRHPVYPDPGETRGQWTWVDQQARPFFGRASTQADNKITAGIVAIAEALEKRAGI